MRLVILFGGRSAEHEISCVSANGVLAAADPARYDITAVGITTAGSWVRAAPGIGGIRAAGDAVEPDEVLAGADVVFPLLHGPYGEDGTVQGLLELADVAFVGSGVLGSALCMDKAMAKAVVGAAGLPQVRHIALRDTDLAEDGDGDGDQALVEASDVLGFPMFVKPANLGSSVGVSRVDGAAELAPAVARALAYDEWIVLEEAAVAAREIECGLLGYPRLRTSVPGEIRPSRRFYDYDDKYGDGAAELAVPAPLPCPVAQEVRRLAAAAGAALRVDGLARVDFLYEEQGRGLLINEVNTMPGFTPISMYPKVWEASGISYSQLIDELIDAALDRHRHRSGRVGNPARSE